MEEKVKLSKDSIAPLVDATRYRLVTGVQTCALPISDAHGGEGEAIKGQQCPLGGRHELPEHHRRLRSEERRVGKEC